MGDGPVPGRGLHLAVAGKGGAGKSVVAGTLARVLARRGLRVLALDSDSMPGLTASLGATAPAEPPLQAAAERTESGRWRVRKGVGPVRAVQRYSTPAPDDVLVLQSGKVTLDGLAPPQSAFTVFYDVVQRIGSTKTFRDWGIVGDLSAGPRQSAYRWAAYAQEFLLVVEPSWKSALTARRIARIVRTRGDVPIRVVANKAKGGTDVALVEQVAREQVFAVIPRDEAVAAADRLGVALIDHAPSSPAALAIGALADRLLGA